MKTTMLMAGGLALTLLGTGCVATHKYVAKSIAPAEQRVSGTEGKNVEQDKQLAAHGTQIEGIDRDLSRTKERARFLFKRQSKWLVGTTRRNRKAFLSEFLTRVNFLHGSDVFTLLR
jgi:hypothetical protein